MTAEKARRRGWWLAAAAFVVLIVVPVILFVRPGAAADWRETHKVVVVEALAYQPSIEISGNMEPLQARDLAFPVNGKVVDVRVAQGQTVPVGALLARLDDRAARYELAAVEASLEQKRLAGAARELQLLQLERDIKAQAVEDRQLRSPIAGRVSVLDMQLGDYAAAGRRVVRVVDVSSLKARVQVDELDAPAVRIGAAVRFFIDALPGLQISGRVAGLSLEGRITSEGLTVVDAEVVIDRPPAELLVGYSFSGEILTGTEQRVLVLPREALFKRAGQTFVYWLPGADAVPQERAVEAEVLDSERIRIGSGLAAGEKVLVPLVGTAGAKGQLTTKGLLKSLQGRSRVPILGGGPSANGEGPGTP